MAFGLTFFDVAPGLRIAGDSLAFAYKFTKKGGDGDGAEGLEIGLTDDPTVKLLETAVSGYTTISDRDSVYAALVAGGLTELVPGLAIGIDSLSSIETTAAVVKLALAGSQPVLQFRRAAVQAVTKVGAGGSTWDLPGATFDALKTAADAYESDLAVKVEEMIAARISADGVLQAAVDAQAVSDATARAAIQADVDQNEADADAAIAAEAATREANDNTIIASVANEATTREAADTALSGRLDVLEADPTTQTLLSAESAARAAADTTLQANIDAEATARAAGDAAAISSANSYTDTAITNLTGTAPAVLDTLGEIAQAINDDANVYTTLVSQITAVQSDVDGNEADADAADAALSGRLDVLEADPTTAAAVAAVQADVDQNESDADAADSALSGRLDVLEADPTTAAAVAAVQADVDQNEADSDAAEAALSGRLDVLEADPTTATAVAAVQADVDANEAAAATARTNLQTTLQNAIDAVQADVNTNEADADAAIATKLGLAGGTLTGNLIVNRQFPDFELKSNEEKRVLFTDAGGGATGAIKNVSSDVDIYAGGVAAGNKELSVKSTGVEIMAALTLSGGLTDAADDTAAAAAGVAVGQLYRNGSVVMIRVS